MGPIFSEKVDKKWSLWDHEQCINTLFTGEWVNHCGWKGKKKKKERKEEMQTQQIKVLSKLTHSKNIFQKESPVV